MKIHKCLRIFILFCKISLIFTQYIPIPRYSHTSALIDSKLYFIGGIDVNNSLRADFFYLDLSIPFTTKSPLSFVSINNNGLTPNAMCTTATINNTVYIFGGDMTDVSSLVYRYDIDSQQWTKPPIAGTSPERRFRNGLIVDPSTKKIYYFGGIKEIVFNDIWSLSLNPNNNQLSWQKITPNGGALPSCYGFTATLLADGNILYIGGKFEKIYIPMNNITRYNIKSNSWDTVQTRGYLPGIRGGHSAVLVPDGRIIVYGGRMVVDDENASFPTLEDLIVLDTALLTYEWVLPKQVENKPEISRTFHTACLYKDYMIVAFGNLTDKTGPTSEILMLNVADKLNYKWITNMPNPPSPTTSNPVPTNSGNGNNNVDVGIIVGASIFGGIMILFIGMIFIYIYKRDRSRPDNYVTPEQK